MRELLRSKSIQDPPSSSPPFREGGEKQGGWIPGQARNDKIQQYALLHEAVLIGNIGIRSFFLSTRHCESANGGRSNLKRRDRHGVSRLAMTE